jgi:hypothetical protein
LPQGLLKKIEFNLLLADLALQRRDAFMRRPEIRSPRRLRLGRKLDYPCDLPRATGRPQSLGTATPEMPTPIVQMATWNLKLTRQRSGSLPRQKPLHRRQLELSAELTTLTFGHRSPLENCPLFSCLILGVHSTRVEGRQ